MSSAPATRPVVIDDRARWWTLVILCFGFLLGPLNGTAIMVGLPSIKSELHFSETSVVWVVNGYLLMYGGFSLLAGRLGDICGHGRMFLIGIMLLTMASLGCGLAASASMFMAGRFAQGVAGAIITASALSQIVTLFQEVSERARALGVCASVGASANSLGLMFGGAVTSTLGWRCIFLVNVVVGACVLVLCFTRLLRAGGSTAFTRQRLDATGAITVTASMTLATYTIVNSNESGWTSVWTVASFVGLVLTLAIFIGIETRSQNPLVPLGLFRLRNLAVASLAGALWSAALLGWSVVSTLYLQRVLQMSPLAVGWEFLLATVIIAVMSLRVTPMLVARFGTRRPLTGGLLIAASGLAVLAQAPVNGDVLFAVSLGMILVGLGSGMTQSPLMLGALGGVPPRDRGGAAGIISTSYAVGGTLGLSIVVSIAAARTTEMLRLGAETPIALASGYQAAFVAAAAFAVLAALISSGLVPVSEQQA